MNGDFLGRGWRFPLLPDASGGLGYVEGDECVEQALRVLLLTSPGERAMRPGLGCAARDLVFAPGADLALRRLEESVSDAIRDHEPRVELESVAAEAGLDEDETTVRVAVACRVRRSNTRLNMVFPYYLGTLERA